MNALKVFEECAKQKSFTAAAQILLISQSAVSKHIRNLEDWFGYNLFEKGHKHIELTPRGRALASELHTVFDKIEGLRDQLNRNGSRLYLKAPPSFASRWLMPRLHTYAPGSMSEVLELGIGSENVDFRTEPFDAAVVCSTAIHDLSAFGRDIMVGEVLNERLTPVMSRELYRRSDLVDPSDLSAERLAMLVHRSGLTQAAFAKHTGLDPSTLSLLLSREGTRTPNAQTLVALAKSWEVSVDCLLGLTDYQMQGSEIMDSVARIEHHVRAPGDALFLEWLEHHQGTRIQTVIDGVPNFLKTEDVIRFEYQGHLGGAKPIRRGAKAARSDAQP